MDEMIQNGVHWYAVHTRSRHEKMVHQVLTDYGIESFLPLRRVHSQWKDRKKWVELPLFPGYLFVHTSAEQNLLVRSTRGVVRMLGPHPLKPSIVPDREVENVRRLVQTHVRVDPYPYLKEGQLICVKRGPLRGVEGIIIRKANRCLLVISVKLLGQAVAVQISAEDVEGL